MKVVEVVRREIKETKREREREKQEKKRSTGNEQARSARFLKKQRERLMDGEQNMWLPI